MPLVYVNRKPGEATLPASVAVVASDDRVADRLQMTSLAETMHGQGNLVIMLGDLASNSAQGRTAGIGTHQGDIALHSNGVDPKSMATGGSDATPDALDAPAKGNLRGTVFKNAKGQEINAVDDAVKLAGGKKVTQFDTVAYELVTPQNYRSFLNR